MKVSMHLQADPGSRLRVPFRPGLHAESNLAMRQELNVACSAN